MELTKRQIDITKGVAILFMLLLHLFCTKDYIGLFKPLIMFGNVPLIYYFALFGDMCVAIYCFCSGYGLMIVYKNNEKTYIKKNIIRLLKLYVNFWIILIIFVLVLGPILGLENNYPGSFKTFILTFLAIDPAYNGAWWFLTTYILLVLASPYINKIIIKYNPIVILILSFGIYFVAYIQRTMVPIVSHNEFINYLIRQSALFGTSLFPYIVGGVFSDKNIYSKLSVMFNKLKLKNLKGILLITLMIIAHGIVQTLFVAVFTGIGFVILFNLIEKPKWLDDTLCFLSKHSTNMWLTHMFFYMIYFKKLVFAPKYPILIFIWLVVLCVISSYCVNIFYKPIVKIIDKKLNYK
ncbi:acyltransferase family protein [Clostridium perfringens]